MFFPTVAISAALLVSPAKAASAEKENEVKRIFERMESDVLAFRDEMERVYRFRCEVGTLAQCFKGSYNDCSSSYPTQQCMRPDELVMDACGDGTGCNALWDKRVTSVRIPGNLASAPQGNPDDPGVIESVCYSRLAEPYMVEKYNDDQSYFNQMYFGSATGAFRIIPARHLEVCGLYDNRRRPWFVSASSGPKDVVLAIDVSGSMTDYGRLVMAKEAAITVVDTLTVADRVAIVTFSDAASVLGGHTSLIRATHANKRLLVEAIKGLEARGATNFFDAFDTAFNALDETIGNEATTGCNIAVLFMTDGQITEGPGADEVIGLVNSRTEKFATGYATPRKATIFTYSLGHHADHDVTKSIACSTNGIWTPVDDFSDDLVAVMSSYYKLYAIGLGEDGNEDFTAWVEPYPFHTGGKMGTSVSAPVYDRSVTPHLFLGVATVDMYMDALEEILGEDASSSEMLDRFVLLSTARCPKIELTRDELDALRFLGGGEEAVCGAAGASEADYTGILPKQCPFVSDFPSFLWRNTDMEGKKYEERACCEAGGFVPSNMCIVEEESNTQAEPTSGRSNVGMIAGVVAGAVVAVGVLVLLWKRRAIKVWLESRRDRRRIRRMENMESSIGVEVSAVLPPEAAPSAPVNPAFNVRN